MAVLIDDTTEEEPVKVVPRATVLERFDAQARYASSGLADTAGPGHLWVVARFGTREHHALVWQPRNLRGETPPPGGACPCGAAHGGAFTAGGSA
jgi:hypothetical protein